MIYIDQITFALELILVKKKLHHYVFVLFVKWKLGKLNFVHTSTHLEPIAQDSIEYSLTFARLAPVGKKTFKSYLNVNNSFNILIFLSVVTIQLIFSNNLFI